jgi:hypothetical protein
MIAKKPRLRLPPALQETEEVAEKSGPRACKFCGHIYVYPCDGLQDCGNRIWLEKREEISGHDVTTYKVQAKNL